MDKVKVEAPDEEPSVIRPWEEVEDEIEKVLQAKKVAEKKITRCDKRLVELSGELQVATRKMREVN